MLRAEENEYVTRVGPGTPMGDLMRQYWVPAMLSSELPRPDCPPVRVLLLGEKLIAFRDTGGRVGLLDNFCPHRGASLFFGRSDECGLRCVYHGWKFDVEGTCVDMPSEPPGSTFENRVRAKAYPCRERGGVVWAYMGPREEAPPLPDLEANQLPEDRWTVTAIQRECSWLQGLEGDIDTAHIGFLHFGSERAEDQQEGTFRYYALKDRAPRYAVLDTDYGSMYGAYRPAGPGQQYWRIAQFLFPFFTMPPSGLLGRQVVARAWVPMDDSHLLFFGMSARTAPEEPSTPSIADARPRPNGTGWYDRFRLDAGETNDYRLDRGRQARDGEYSGIAGVHLQDQAITESMGPIYDRTREHLGSSDAMVIRVRRRLIAAARALAESAATPPGVDGPQAYRQRSGGVILDESADWVEATRDLRRAYVEHPGLDPAITGGFV
ncbi:MAG: Rieske 2Fe-2S domain-containing protein [Chloroflexi bacterium]|nr:MAG: Rieske 2Fe-2S domain-containing protein [Chloroflexota bacterium]